MQMPLLSTFITTAIFKITCDMAFGHFAGFVCFSQSTVHDYLLPFINVGDTKPKHVAVVKINSSCLGNEDTQEEKRCTSTHC